MKRVRVENGMHPLWVVPKGMGRGVDESKETADGVARHHAN